MATPTAVGIGRHIAQSICEESVGFTEIDPWRSCFWHDVLKLYLVVYVDDFKLAGPTPAIKKGGS